LENNMLSVKKMLVVAVAGLALCVTGTAQVANPQLDVDRSAEEITLPSPDALFMTNMGELRPIEFGGHVLTVGAGGTEGGGAILYAPSEADDPGYRAAISAAAGGATVDYFDARVGTPSVALLSNYDCVHVWANFAFLNNVAYGDNLAAFNDAGGDVVMGSFCTYTNGNSLSGTIMTPAYSPVWAPSGSNHFTFQTYSGGGTTCIYNGVSTLTSQFRDILALQGTGVADGFYPDSEICHAYRSGTSGAQGDVIYSNGSGAIQLSGVGDWNFAVANACTCGVATASAWTDEGSALGGVNGDPVLTGSGSMIPDTWQTLTLTNGAGSALSAILGSASSAPQAFKGGTLLPGPIVVVFYLNTSPAGGWSVSFRSPAEPSGFEIWAQVGIEDGAAVQGVSLSNAVKGTIP
jgi:hypothetical protein